MPAGMGVTAGRVHRETPAPLRGGCPVPLLLPLPRKHRSKRNLEGFAGVAHCFPCCLPVREWVIKAMELGISLLLASLSPAKRRVPFLGAAHAPQLRSAACSWGHRPLNVSSLGRKGSRNSHTRNREWARVRTRRGSSSDFSHQKLGLTRPSKARRAPPGDAGYPASVTERVSRPCKGSLSFLLASEGATGITTTQHPRACSWRVGHSHSASSTYSTKSEG